MTVAHPFRILAITLPSQRTWGTMGSCYHHQLITQGEWECQGQFKPFKKKYFSGEQAERRSSYKYDEVKAPGNGTCS